MICPSNDEPLGRDEQSFVVGQGFQAKSPPQDGAGWTNFLDVLVLGLQDRCICRCHRILLLWKHHHAPDHLYKSGLRHESHEYHWLMVSGVARLLCVLQLRVCAITHSHRWDWRGVYPPCDDAATSAGEACTAPDVGATSRSHSEGIATL